MYFKYIALHVTFSPSKIRGKNLFAIYSNVRANGRDTPHTQKPVNISKISKITIISYHRIESDISPYYSHMSPCHIYRTST